MPAFLIQTLGCKLNQLESEAVTDAFIQKGFSECTAGNESAPDIIIINTCTVTSKADQKARRVIRKALCDYPEAGVIVTGCYAQLNRTDILKLDAEGRLFIVNKNDILTLPQHLNMGTETGDAGSSAVSRGAEIKDMLKSLRPQDDAQDHKNLFQFNPNRFSRHTRAYLKIQDGCDKNCTYCKIRLARGKSVSLKADEVLSRLRMLEKTHAEASLTGVNISQYRDRGTGIGELLKYLLDGTEKIRIRLSSLAPESVDEKLADVLSHPRIRPHFHLSVQSLSDKILNKMGRSYKSETVENALPLLRRIKDDPFIACDIITGFPGETQEDFERTFKACKELDFAWIHVFPYSKRQGTPAFLFNDNVTDSEVIKRAQLLTELAKQGRGNYARRWLGKEVEVLIESGNKNGGYAGINQVNLINKTGQDCFFGTSENYLKVLIKTDGTELNAGTALRCKLKEVHNSGDFYFAVQAECQKNEYTG